MEIRIKKGRDLSIAGGVAPDRKPHPVAVRSAEIAISPDDFPGFTPKVDVHEGDVVAAGDALMHQKSDPRTVLVSPVSGRVKAVVRGERRKVLRVVVEADAEAAGPRKFKTGIPADADAAAELLALSGLLAMMRKRPYDIVPDADERPRDIFVTAIDSAPLALDTPYGPETKPAFDAAVATLQLLTKGKVYISRRADAVLPDIKGAEAVSVQGPHPAGLVGTQINAIRPINKGQTVWTTDIHTLYKIGTLVLTGSVDWNARVAVTGSCVVNPYIAVCVPGTAISSLVGEKSTEGAISCTDKDGNCKHTRIISGNILTGTRVGEDDFLRWPYTQVTVIPEGDDIDEFMGWASLSPALMSESPSFTGKWLRKIFKPDARIHGGRRAMIMSGIYENLIPLDIMPEYLIKAIQSDDIDNMERLGIYEVAPEDFALAEYADSSKLPLQSIVRHGLDLMRKETE